MRPILTLTPNPALDLSTATAFVAPGQKLRCQAPRVDPGGGGVNVSRAILQLGGASRALVALGGANGAALSEALRAQGLDFIAFAGPGDTRQSFAVTDISSNAQYRFSTPGPDWAEADVARYLTAVEDALLPEALCVFSGSAPPGAEGTMLPSLRDLMRERGAQFLVDTSGAALSQMAETGAGPDILRMDQAEAEFLAGGPLADRAAAAQFARHLTRAAQTVIIAMGPDGSVLADRGGALWHAGGADVPVVSKIGAGDSFVGGYALSIARGAAPQIALQYGMAAASGAVMTPGTELCHAKDVVRLVSACPLTDLS